MGRPDSILGQFRETAQCRDANFFISTGTGFMVQLVTFTLNYIHDIHLVQIFEFCDFNYNYMKNALFTYDYTVTSS